MDTTTLLIIILVIIILGGGGWYGRGRWFQTHGMQSPRRLFARPQRLVEPTESFEIADDGGRPLAYVYFEDERVRAGILKRMTKDEARRLAAQIVRLPDLLEELKLHRAARDEPA